MSSIAIPISKSYFPFAQHVSAYDIALPLVSISNDYQVTSIIGTCFPIANGLYVTAAHNFDIYEEVRRVLNLRGEYRFMLDEMVDEQSQKKCGIVILENKKLQGISLVNRLTVCVDHDLAFLFVSSDYRSRVAPLLSIIESPSIGDKIRVIGYPRVASGVSNFIVVDPESQERTVNMALVQGEGVIISSLPDGRGLGANSYPCFETTAEMHHGQSGGPTLCCDKLAVVGVNSRGMPTGSHDTPYSIVSWIGKALDEAFGFDDVEFRTPSGQLFHVNNTSLRALDAAGIIRII